MRERTEIAAKMRAVEALVVDVEGSLTDGLLTLGGEDGTVGRLQDHDLVGLQLAKAAGWPVVLLASGNSPALKTWADEAGIDQVAMDVVDKRVALQAAAKALKFEPDVAAYLGDDLLDLPAMELCGLAAAPRNAVVLVREKADLVIEMPAGHGAVRELVDRVLAAQDKTCDAIGAYLKACGNVQAGDTLGVDDESTLRPKIGFRG